MNCYNHPGREPVGSCVSCGQLVCPECEAFLGGKVYCSACANNLVRTTAMSQGSTWFERHLNWTMVLAWVGAWVLAFVIGFLAAITSPSVSEESFLAFGTAIDLIVFLAVSIPVGLWVLKKKNRSAAWLLLCWTWFFLLISNKSNLVADSRIGAS